MTINKLSSVPRTAIGMSSVPPTTNKTAGYTPHPIATKGRRIDFDTCVEGNERSLVKKPRVIISRHAMSGTNYMWLVKLPDGWVMTFAAKGNPYGENGYLDSAYKTMMDSLQSEYNEKDSFATNMNVSAVLTMRHPETLQTREIMIKSKTTGGTKPMKLLCFAQNQRYLNDVSPERWCINQVSVLKNWFPKINYLTFGGDASLNGMPPISSLDQILDPDDVANLAFSLYDEKITDGSFFENGDLLNSYFNNTDDVISLFKTNGMID